MAQLDIGDPTPVLMSSRDERTLLVASFGDIRACLEKVCVLIIIYENNHACVTGARVFVWGQCRRTRIFVSLVM